MKNKNIITASNTIMDMCVSYQMGSLSEKMFAYNIKGYAKYIDEQYNNVTNKKKTDS